MIMDARIYYPALKIEVLHKIQVGCNFHWKPWQDFFPEFNVLMIWKFTEERKEPKITRATLETRNRYTGCQGLLDSYNMKTVRYCCKDRWTDRWKNRALGQALSIQESTVVRGKREPINTRCQHSGLLIHKLPRNGAHVTPWPQINFRCTTDFKCEKQNSNL